MNRLVFCLGPSGRVRQFLLGVLLLWCTTSLAEPQSSPGAPSREQLADLLQDENPHLRAYAVYNLVYRYPEDAAEVVRCTSDPDPWVRRAAVFSLGLLMFEPETERFILALKDPHYGVRRAAVFALGNIKTARALEGLAEALQDSDSVTRQLAVLAIARAGSKAYVPRLTPLLADDSPRVRRAAACALGMLGDPSALDPLRQLYRNRRCSEPAQRLALADREVEKALNKKINLDYKFMHFAETLAKLSEAAGVQITVDDELLFVLNTSAADPENLNSIKLAMWNVRFRTALTKIAQTVRSYWYVESGTINLASERYEAYDTPVRLEVAAAMALLGDRSALSEVRSFLSHRRFGSRARELLRAVGK